MKLSQEDLKPIVQAIVKEIYESKDFQRLLTNAVRQATWDVIRARDREEKKLKPSDDGMATVKQACQFLSVSAMTVYRMIANKDLPSTRVRESHRIPWAALKEYAEPKNKKKK